jgi:hypothetical protein
MVPYSDKFLEALGAWQRGWCEDRLRRVPITTQLEAAIAASVGLPEQARRVDRICYRKRFLVPNNPQNNGDFVPLIFQGRVDDGVASWTTDQKYAQDFKDTIREGSVSAIFAHKPIGNEVVLNIPALWTIQDFRDAVKAYTVKEGPNSDALQHFKSRQSEVILTAPLLPEEVVGFCGRSSPFDLLCQLAGKTTEVEKDQFWQELVENDTFPEDRTWLKTDAAQRALKATEIKFMAKVAAIAGRPD